MVVEYVEVHDLGDYKQAHYRCNFCAYSYFKEGALYYFRVNRFEYKTVPSDKLISIKEDGETLVIGLYARLRGVKV